MQFHSPLFGREGAWAQVPSEQQKSEESQVNFKEKSLLKTETAGPTIYIRPQNEKPSRVVCTRCFVMPLKTMHKRESC